MRPGRPVCETSFDRASPLTSFRVRLPAGDIFCCWTWFFFFQDDFPALRSTRRLPEGSVPFLARRWRRGRVFTHSTVDSSLGTLGGILIARDYLSGSPPHLTVDVLKVRRRASRLKTVLSQLSAAVCLISPSILFFFLGGGGGGGGGGSQTHRASIGSV